MVMKKTLVIMVIMVALLAIVWHRSFAATSKQKTVTNETNILCPHITQLKKSALKGNWFAQTKAGTWKSYGLSFATDITEFVGAQWAGEEVGQVTCIYNSEQKSKIEGKTNIQPTLPVLLVFHTLTFQPKNGKWKHVSRGVYNCYSHTQSDCPFKMNVKPPIGNIYQEAEALKKD